MLTKGAIAPQHRPGIINLMVMIFMINAEEKMRKGGTVLRSHSSVFHPLPSGVLRQEVGGKQERKK